MIAIKFFPVKSYGVFILVVFKILKIVQNILSNECDFLKNKIVRLNYHPNLPK